MTIAEALAVFRAAGGTVWVEGDRTLVAPTDPDAPDAQAALAALRERRGEVRAVLADVATHLDRRCVRSPRVWTEADRLHDDYRAQGGRLDRATYLAALLADGRAWLGPAGLVCGVGLVQDWGPEDGGTRAARERGGHHAV